MLPEADLPRSPAWAGERGKHRAGAVRGRQAQVSPSAGGV
jgi:hypothetical protein